MIMISSRVKKDLDDFMVFSESLWKKLFARLPFFEIQMASILSTASGPAKSASDGLAISLSLHLGLRVGNPRILGV